MAKTYPRITFGTAEFSGAEIQEAIVTEEFNPLSITIPISTLEVTLYSNDVAFSIVNPTGKYQSLLAMQPMAVYEVIDGQEHFIGQYYLDDWDSPSENIKHLTCFDVMGVLDRHIYRGDLIMTPTPAGTVFANIFNEIGIGYEIDPDVAAIEIYGWIPVSSYREALQQVCFATGSYILTARQDSVTIGRLSQIAVSTSGIRTGVAHTGQTRVYQLRWRGTQSFAYTSGGAVTRGLRSGVPHTGQSRVYQKRWRSSQWEGVKPVVDIPSSQQGNRKLFLRPQVTGVEVTAHDIIQGTGSLKLLDQTMVAGTHEVLFQQPMHTLSITGATITQSNPNYAIISVATSGTVVLTGLVYVDTKTTYSMYLPTVAGRKDNIMRIDDATLVNAGNAATICEQVFNYYQQRYIQNAKLYSQTKYTEVGGMVNAETLHGNHLVGTIERMTTDLAGGNISDTDIIGIIV